MTDYFKLQFKMLNRRIIEFGLPLILGYSLIPFIFFLLSFYLFENTEFAIFAYALLALSFVSRLNDPKRNDFLKTLFNTKRYLLLRALENIIYTLPFTIFLIYKQLFLWCLLLNVLVVITSLFNFSTALNMTIPTPFSKNPFEFVVGFRKTFFVFPIAYFLTYISISVGNFNLGIFSMLLIGMVCFSYYSTLEKDYFIWNYALSSKEFLYEKAKTCLTYFTLISLPIILALSISFFNELLIIIVFFMLCNTYLATIVFAKYSSFPNEINLSQGLIIAMSFMFPPMLFIITPYFYSQSIKKLNSILE